MIKQILVAASGLAGEEQAFATALAVARQNGAHLQFLHVQRDAMTLISSMADGGLGAGAFLESVVTQFEADMAAEASKAKEMVSRYCTKMGVALDDAGQPGSGVTAEFVKETGEPVGWVTECGRFADLLVVSRPGGDERPIGLIEAALVSTGRPILIAGRGPVRTSADVVMIAWKDRSEAARAVAGAMPFIDRAKRVLIVSVEEDGAAPQESCERLQRYLRWHNPATEIVRAARGGRSAATVLADAASHQSAGLLVMGGYSHSRMREMVFGGVTREILNNNTMETPVLMVH